MTEYKDKVAEQELILKVEAWANVVSDIHTFDSDTTIMGYDYPNTTREGYVTDTTFNDGRVERLVHKTQKRYTIGNKLNSIDLLTKYQRGK